MDQLSLRKNKKKWFGIRVTWMIGPKKDAENHFEPFLRLLMKSSKLVNKFIKHFIWVSGLVASFRNSWYPHSEPICLENFFIPSSNRVWYSFRETSLFWAPYLKNQINNCLSSSLDDCKFQWSRWCREITQW